MVDIKETMVTAARDGHTITRNIGHFRQIDNDHSESDNEDEDDLIDDLLNTRDQPSNNPPIVENPPAATENQRNYPQRNRTRPDFYHELTGW